MRNEILNNHKKLRSEIYQYLIDLCLSNNGVFKLAKMKGKLNFANFNYYALDRIEVIDDELRFVYVYSETWSENQLFKNFKIEDLIYIIENRIL